MSLLHKEAAKVGDDLRHRRGIRPKHLRDYQDPHPELLPAVFVPDSPGTHGGPFHSVTSTPPGRARRGVTQHLIDYPHYTVY